MVVLGVCLHVKLVGVILGRRAWGMGKKKRGKKKDTGLEHLSIGRTDEQSGIGKDRGA